MPTFSYKATDMQGKVVTGILEGADEKRVAAKLQEGGLIPMRIRPADKKGGLSALRHGGVSFSLFGNVGAKDVLVFTQDLSALLTAGLPLDRSLTILIDAAEKPKVKDMLRDMLRTVQGGGYLSDALFKHGRVFSTLYINMVKAGEAGGVLEEVLIRLGEFLESSQELKDYIKSAMVYPLFLVSVGGLSIIVLLTFVIPKFAVIFADMGQSMPLSTRLLLGFSEAVRTWWPLIALVLILVFVLVRRYIRTPAGRFKRDQVALRLPVGGDLVKKIEVARFSRTLGTLTRSGVPILQALNLVKDVLTNQVISGRMAQVYTRVKEGERLSKPLSDSKIFPALAIQMITVGEETGRLDAMLLRVADNYEKIVRAMVKRFVALLEPAMILIMGLIVGAIVISMLMAIFSMNEMPF